MNPDTLALLDSDRQGLLAAVARVQEADRDRRPAENQWSVAEVLDHLVSVERAVTKLLELRGQETVPPNQEPPIANAAERLRSLRTRERRVQVPEALKPRADVSAQAAVVALGESRAALLGAARRAHPDALAHRTYHHAVIGRITLNDWLAFVAHHEARHAAQIDEIAEAFRR